MRLQFLILYGGRTRCSHVARPPEKLTHNCVAEFVSRETRQAPATAQRARSPYYILLLCLRIHKLENRVEKL